MSRELLAEKKPLKTSKAFHLLTQRKDEGANKKETVPPIMRETLNSPGQLLDVQARAFFERRFEYDFSRVRVHTTAKAVESASSIGARAYIVKNHIVFGQGKYVPSTSIGRQLLKHELTHVI
jgi:hypothetical protein